MRPCLPGIRGLVPAATLLFSAMGCSPVAHAQTPCANEPVITPKALNCGSDSCYLKPNFSNYKRYCFETSNGDWASRIVLGPPAKGIPTSIITIQSQATADSTLHSPAVDAPVPLYIPELARAFPPGNIYLPRLPLHTGNQYTFSSNGSPFWTIAHTGSVAYTNPRHATTLPVQPFTIFMMSNGYYASRLYLADKQSGGAPALQDGSVVIINAEAQESSRLYTKSGKYIDTPKGPVPAISIEKGANFIVAYDAQKDQWTELANLGAPPSRTK